MLHCSVVYSLWMRLFRSPDFVEQSKNLAMHYCVAKFWVCCVERNRRVLEGVRGRMWIIIILFLYPYFFFFSFVFFFCFFCFWYLDLVYFLRYCFFFIQPGAFHVNDLDRILSFTDSHTIGVGMVRGNFLLKILFGLILFYHTLFVCLYSFYVQV